jgi:hypothetical protein
MRTLASVRVGWSALRHGERVLHEQPALRSIADARVHERMRHGRRALHGEHRLLRVPHIVRLRAAFGRIDLCASDTLNLEVVS